MKLSFDTTCKHSAALFFPLSIKLAKIDAGYESGAFDTELPTVAVDKGIDAEPL